MKNEIKEPVIKIGGVVETSLGARLRIVAADVDDYGIMFKHIGTDIEIKREYSLVIYWLKNGELKYVSMPGDSEQINKFIAENGGNERDALNVALARLELAERQLHYYKEELSIYKKMICSPSL